MDIRNFVDDLDVTNGATVRRNCPVCDGVKTFTVTNKNGMIIWNCYKAGCFVHGGTRTYLSADDIRNTMQSREVEEPVWEKPVYIVQGGNHDGLKNFLAGWYLHDMQPCPMYDVKENRIVFPIFRGRTMVDGAGRSLSNRLPKWKRYGESGLPYIYGSGQVAVIVEDAISASVVGSSVQCAGVALLGTSLQDTHKKPLAEYTKLIVALDPDALSKTLSIAQELRTIHTNISVLRLKDDLKYRNPQDIKNLENLIWN
tara:strand:+ start:141 stop:908 length:768 start_codon:yes stop_codon:yes gene_type:complete